MHSRSISAEDLRTGVACCWMSRRKRSNICSFAFWNRPDALMARRRNARRPLGELRIVSREYSISAAFSASGPATSAPMLATQSLARAECCVSRQPFNVDRYFSSSVDMMIRLQQIQQLTKQN
uniref:(northern house mosquito) hypothetical protein n=1 Tax=Culex pipiens TaxID=7175 RepID=A0A8D8NAW1_CULPI